MTTHRFLWVVMCLTAPEAGADIVKAPPKLCNHSLLHSTSSPVHALPS